MTIVSYLRMVTVALNAAKALEEQGIDAEVVDLRTLKPMDTDALVQSLKKTHHLVVLEEDYTTCGTGSEIVARMQYEAFDHLDAPMERVTTAEVPIPYARNLERSAIPNEQSVIDAVLRTLSRESLPADVQSAI